MNLGREQSAARLPAKLTILLVDANSERRALRKRIMALHGVDMVGAGDLAEARSIWHPDRYDMVLIDIRRDRRGSLAWRDEVKKEKPKQVVAFLVGRPRFVDFDPLVDSYDIEERGAQWGDALRQAVRKSCESLPQRNGFAEAGWRITAAKKIGRTPNTVSQVLEPAEAVPAMKLDISQDWGEAFAGAPESSEIE